MILVLKFSSPIDNQRGEFVYEDHGLRFSQLEVSQELISMEDIEK